MSSTSGRARLGLAAVAVAFAAADTYVVVLALPDMMSGVGLSIDQLQRAAPIVSGFLLGYVAALPLVGRIADLRGRLPVLLGSLLLFALGSLVTAGSYDLASLVVGRFLQGVGGGGLVPATLALVADLYPPDRRGVPLGVVGAVQEIGSLLGPLYGAVVLALAGWRAIFVVNLLVALVLAIALFRVRDTAPAEPVRTREPTRRWPADPAGLLVGGLGLLALVLVLFRPAALADQVTLGLGFVPLFGASRWWSPVGLAVPVLAVALLARSWVADRPVLAVRRWRAVARETDVLGASLLALCLSGVVVAFASADPQHAVLSPQGPWLLLGAVFLAAGFGWRQRTGAVPLLPRGAFAATPAWGALATSLFVGAALIAALVDIPVFARVTVFPTSQLDAALVLVRFLVALPVGALAGGFAIRRLPAGPVAAAGMALAAAGFVVMGGWGPTSLRDPVATVPLVAAGFGVGLAVAPVNASLLAATDRAVHGVASALLVVARMVGMLVGVSVLTEVGLRRFYAAQVALPSPARVCHPLPRCHAYDLLLERAGLTQLHTVFVGAAICAVVAALVALATFRRTR